MSDPIWRVGKAERKAVFESMEAEESATMKAMYLVRSSNPFLAALTVLACGRVMAFLALQFDAAAPGSVSRTEGAVVAWGSTRGGVIASPCHANGNGWAAPQYDSRRVVGFSSATGTASPISFPLTETGLVARAFIVADGTSAAFCSTLLDDSCSPVFHLLHFRVNGLLLSTDSDSLVVAQSPDDLNPQIFFVEVLNSELTPLDYLWVVISCKQSRKLYDDWKAAETNLAWTLGLPKPFSTLAISTNSLGVIVANDSGLVSWNKSEEMNPASFMHHDASYEMRSLAIAGGHGHQATYNASGELITATIAAGTADKVSPQSIWNGTAARHRMTDVHPYIRALQLDGNPILTDNLSGMFTDSIPTRFSRPCLFQGDEANAYLDRRPPTPTGVQY